MDSTNTLPHNFMARRGTNLLRDSSCLGAFVGQVVRVQEGFLHDTGMQYHHGHHHYSGYQCNEISCRFLKLSVSMLQFNWDIFHVYGFNSGEIAVDKAI